MPLSRIQQQFQQIEQYMKGAEQTIYEVIGSIGEEDD